MKTSLISALLMGTLLASQAWAGELTKMFGSREGRSNHAFMYQEKDCKTCHLGAPKGPATETACLECHGDYQQIAEQTRDSKPNPHDAPHWGADVPCTVCHSEHKPAKVLCNDCHQFTFSNFSH
ncbi:cytochrome c3 family protein [Shewanella algae]|uniref:cytochrome c3 family protein n=1 Tax=Shewanella algae TaxID=38313 RepID=UPI001BEFA968|nr:cytochrome c3 family protein [Shewanella algae]BCV51348.1 cytochrome c [Shewanella algae]